MSGIIARLADLGYRATQTTIYTLATFWKQADRASDYLNQKAQGTKLFTNSVPRRVDRPSLIRVSYTMKVSMKDRSLREFYFNEFDIGIDATKGELDGAAFQHAMSVLAQHYEIELAYIAYTSVIAV